jgi:hypothetical protein
MADGMDQFQAMLEADKRGCEVLPLPINYRCSQAVVLEAQSYVPDLEACETAPAGEVGTVDMATMYSRVQPGDAILCRINAPMLTAAVALVKSHKAVRVFGRDELGKDLIAFIDTLCENRCQHVSALDLIGRVDKWQAEKEAELGSGGPSKQYRLHNAQQRAECVRILASAGIVTLQGTTVNVQTAKDVLTLIDLLFYDGEDTGAAVNLSSIHKSKGFEFPNVYLLHPELLPHPKASTPAQLQQERNMAYVAITRSKVAFYYVRD